MGLLIYLVPALFGKFRKPCLFLSTRGGPRRIAELKTQRPTRGAGLGNTADKPPKFEIESFFSSRHLEKHKKGVNHMEKIRKLIAVLAGVYLLAGSGLALARGGGGGGMGAGGMGGSRGGASMSGQGMEERMEKRGEEGIEQGKKKGVEHRATPAKPATPANPTPGSPGATPAVPATPATPAPK